MIHNVSPFVFEEKIFHLLLYVCVYQLLLFSEAVIFPSVVLAGQNSFLETIAVVGYD